jgi:hypothetical protein
MNKDDLKEIKTIIDASLETHLAAVHEEITDLRGEFGSLRTELRGEIGMLRQEMRDGFEAVNSKLGGLNNRVDNETFARKDLEHRLRRVLPDLPEPARS